MRSFTVAAAAIGLASSIASAAPVAGGTAPPATISTAAPSNYNNSRRPSFGHGNGGHGWGQGGHGRGGQGRGGQGRGGQGRGHGNGGHGWGQDNHGQDGSSWGQGGQGGQGGYGNGQGNGKQNDVGVEIVGNGFPFPDPEQLINIEDEAKGVLSNAPPPAKLSDDTATSLRLVALNENFESVYFQDLLNNVTHGREGYGLEHFKDEEQRQFVITSLTAIVAQEQLHAINAENALKNVVKANPIQPCRYKFPVSDFKSAINLAARFTDVVMGTLADVQFQAASNGDAGFVPGVAASLANEGEQTGWFRTLQGLRPSELPFLTRSVRNFAFSALQDFVLPGSCPNLDEIDLTIYQPLVAADPPAKTTDISFSFNYLKQTRFVPEGVKTVDVTNFGEKYGQNKWEGQLFITYLNQVSVPVSRPLKTASFNFETGDVTVTAEFPHDAVVNGKPLLMNGLSLATLTTGQDFANAQAMDAATLFGPAPLQAIE